METHMFVGGVLDRETREVRTGATVIDAPMIDHETGKYVAVRYTLRRIDWYTEPRRVVRLVAFAEESLDDADVLTRIIAQYPASRPLHAASYVGKLVFNPADAPDGDI